MSGVSPGEKGGGWIESGGERGEGGSVSDEDVAHAGDPGRDYSG